MTVTSQGYHQEEFGASPLERLEACIEVTRELHLPGVQSAVLKHVAYRAGGSYQCCFQKLNEMAADIGFSKRTVQSALDLLVDRGLLLKTPGGFGRGDASAYILRFEIKVAGDSDKVASPAFRWQQPPPSLLPINGTSELKDNLTMLLPARDRENPSEGPETPKARHGCPDCGHPSYPFGDCLWCKNYGREA